MAVIEQNKIEVSNHCFSIKGWWSADNQASGLLPAEELEDILKDIGTNLYIVARNDKVFLAKHGNVSQRKDSSKEQFPVVAVLNGVTPDKLGDSSFCRDYNLQFPYIAGSMAHGINSKEIVKEFAINGMLAFFGTAGMPCSKIADIIDWHKDSIPDKTYGFNLIHSPNEPRLEAALVDLFLKKGVNLIEASAYMGLSLPVVKFRVAGIHRDSAGKVVAPNRIIAKVSRVEVATRFFSPPPEDILQKLVDSGNISKEQAEMAREIPMAQDVTAEADSGGHTDNRPAFTLIPTIIALRDQLQKKYGYSQKLRVGTGGGISTPYSAAAAFSMGASYIVTGSVNQGCVEAGTSDIAKEILANTGQADVTMAPCADMFEMGAKVQVVKRGTMYPMRAAKLYELYKNYDSWIQIPDDQRKTIEKSFFRNTFQEIWSKTYEYFEERDSSRLVLAEKDDRYKMGLVFRWYLSQASHWAIKGDQSRKIDYQIWCGPAMGAFNQWVEGTFLEDRSQRKVITVAANILYGACLVLRINQLKFQGFNPEQQAVNPEKFEHIKKYFTK